MYFQWFFAKSNKLPRSESILKGVSRSVFFCRRFGLVSGCFSCLLLDFRLLLKTATLAIALLSPPWLINLLLLLVVLFAFS